MARPEKLNEVQFGRVRGQRLKWPPKQGQQYDSISFQLSQAVKKGEETVYENMTFYRPLDLYNLMLVAEDLLRAHAQRSTEPPSNTSESF